MSAPLADLMRPQTIDEVVGQSHILNKDGILYRIAQSGRAANLIFYAIQFVFEYRNCLFIIGIKQKQ